MSRDATFPLGPALELLSEVWALDRAIAIASKRMMARSGATMQQRVVLGIIRRYPTITPGRLARLLHLDAGTISATIKRLEGQRWVERRTHPRDRRRVSIGLTESGYALDGSNDSPVEKGIARALARLDDRELVVFRHVLAIFVEEISRDDEASSQG